MGRTHARHSTPQARVASALAAERGGASLAVRPPRSDISALFGHSTMRPTATPGRLRCFLLLNSIQCGNASKPHTCIYLTGHLRTFEYTRPNFASSVEQAAHPVLGGRGQTITSHGGVTDDDSPTMMRKRLPPAGRRTASVSTLGRRTTIPMSSGPTLLHPRLRDGRIRHPTACGARPTARIILTCCWLTIPMQTLLSFLRNTAPTPTTTIEPMRSRQGWLR